MSQFQAGTIVVYGNLGVHEIENVCQKSFCGEPAREYYTLRPYFLDSNDRSYIPTDKENVIRPVVSQEQAQSSLEKIRTEEISSDGFSNQTFLAAHYQELLHANDFYEDLKLFKELYRKQKIQKSKGRKTNAMDVHFYQLTERILKEELAIAFHETPEEADKRLKEAVS